MAETVAGELVEYGSLSANEQVIEKGMTSFVEVGRALACIRDDRQYVMAGFDTFEDYCRERWDLGHRFAANQIDAARVVGVIEAQTGARAPVEPPRFEFHARPLVKVLNEHGEEAVVTTWEAIVERHTGEGPITGREVSRFLSLGANYGKPGWHELLGQVGDTLLKAQREFERFEASLGERRPAQPLREKATRYAEWAESLATALREAA